jgi:tetratricopeptide (TPR) repeat protein
MTYQRHVRARSWQVTLILTLFFFAVAGAAGIGWWYARESPPHQGPIVLITVDGLPADAVAPQAAAGSDPSSSEPAAPSALAALAADAVIFDRAYTHSAQLLPAQASLLTGQLPYEHGVRDDIGFVLGQDALTLAELLHNRGFNTGAAVSSFLLRKATGVARGFSTYTEADEDAAGAGAAPDIARASADASARTPLARPVNTPRGAGASPSLAAGDVDAAGTTTPVVEVSPIDAAATFAGAQRNQRYFLLLQVDAAQAETAVARLVTVLKDRRLYDGATIVLVGERGRIDGPMEESTLRVPLLVKQPQREGAGRHVAVTVQHIDLLPTILDLVRAPIPSDLRGRSLRPVLTEVSGRIPPQPIYSESLAAAYRFGGQPTFSLTLNDLRYVRSGPESLVRIDPVTAQAAPAASSPVDADTSTTTGEMPPLRATLDRMLNGRTLPRAASVPPRDRDRLAHAGILSGLQTAADAPVLSASQEEIAVSHRDAAQLVGLGRLAPAVRALQQIVKTDPMLAPVHYQIGVLATELGQTSDAIAALQQAAALRPDAPEVARALARALMRAGRLADADAQAEIAIKASEDFGAAEVAASHDLAARIALARSDPDTALAHADAVQSANPSVPMRAFIEGRLLSASGGPENLEKAARVLRGALALVRQRDGALEGLQLALGQTLAALDQPEAAEAAVRAELLEFPRSVTAYSELVQLLHAADRNDEASGVIDALLATVPTPDGYAAAARLWTALGENARAADVRSDARGRFPAESTPVRTARATAP